MDPTIRLQKCLAPEWVRIQRHHPRLPDIGTGILVTVRPSPGESEEYYGVYLGHGQSKTAFELKSYECNQNLRFDGKVLKVSRKKDMEPLVFTEASKCGVATSILYDGGGVDVVSGQPFHCWITDCTIPLDELCRCEDIINKRCTLAAFCCMLKAAQLGLYLSDCHFYNFGLRVTQDATEHAVVIIDAGSRGIGRGTPWKKSQVTKTVMKKFWAHCREESATNREIEYIWSKHKTLEPCLQEATDLWETWPYLTKSTFYVGRRDNSSYAMWQAMSDRDASERSMAQATSAFKIVAIVGRWTAAEEWNNAYAFVSYRAASTTKELTAQEDEILDELYQRLTRGKRDEEVQNVMAFWERLREYQSRWGQSSEDQAMTPADASRLLERFKWDELWYELTPEQKQSDGWHSTVSAILHKRSAWKHAAQAIMLYGLPRLEQPEHPDDATEHINALGQFVVNLAKWLKSFASGMHAYKQTERYQQEVQRSRAALENRMRRAAGSH